MKIAPSYTMKLGPIELLSRQGGVTARLTCDQCGVHDAWNLVKLPEPGVIKRHFTVRGWDMRKSAKCPQCQENNRKRKVTGIKPTTSEPPKEPSEAAKRAKRLIYQALEAYYDEQKKCYKNGKSDKAVANEVGASEAFVRQIREADFGPIEIDGLAIKAKIVRSRMVSDNAWMKQVNEILDSYVKALLSVSERLEAEAKSLRDMIGDPIEYPEWGTNICHFDEFVEAALGKADAAK
jgi:hypothetical protein